MKAIYQITLISLLSILLYSCQKEKASIEITKDILFSEKIENMDQYLTDFKAKMSNPPKSGEMLNLEDARWHLSALLNFSYADAKTHYEFFPVDTFYITLSLYNHQVSLQALNDAFYELSGFITSAYHAIESDDKTLIVAEVGIESIDNNEAEAWVVSTMGYNPPLVGPTFAETDWWYWGFGGHYGTGPGKCGEYEGEGVGSDASVELTNKAMMSIPIPSGRVYYTDQITFYIHPEDYSVSPEDHPFGRHSLLFMEFPPVEPWCLCPDEMNYYLNNIKFIIMPDLRPAGKDIIKYFVESDWLHEIVYVHFAHFTFGIPHVTPYPPDL